MTLARCASPSMFREIYIYSNTNVHARVEISRTSENQKKNKCG
jgi:hypothetical protein